MPKTVKPEETLEMLRMHEDEEMTYGEIAEEKGYSKPTVRRHVKQAQEIMKRRKREYDEDVRNLRERNEELREEIAALKEELKEFKEEKEEEKYPSTETYQGPKTGRSS